MCAPIIWRSSQENCTELIVKDRFTYQGLGKNRSVENRPPHTNTIPNALDRKLVRRIFLGQNKTETVQKYKYKNKYWVQTEN